MDRYNDNNEHRNLIKKVSLALVVLATIVVGVRLYIAEIRPLILITGVSLILFYYGVFALVGKDLSERISSWAIITSTFLIVFAISYSLGGLETPMVVITPFICMVSFLLLRGNGGWWVSVATVSALLCFIILGYTGHNFPANSLSENQEGLMRGVWLIFATCLITYTLHYFKQENAKLEERLFEESITDHLTGLYNRRYFEQLINLELSRIERNKAWLSVLLIDIDHFKLYNDTYGHTAGDQCLVQLSETFRSYFKRSLDMVVRYGGEEFLVILPETKFEEAYELAEQLRQAVKNLNILHAESEYKTVTVSIGINSINGKDRSTIEGLIKKADAALYESKNKGRNATSPDSLDIASEVNQSQE